MVAINHATTGALIGLSVTNPLLAIPAAVLSHFALDALPHYGSEKSGFIGTKKFSVMLGVDALLCVLLVVFLALTQPHYWLLGVVCAFMAAAPDFLWLPKYLAARSGKTHTPTRFDIFAARIQWFQRPIGAVVEVAWFVAAIALLFITVRT